MIVVYQDHPEQLAVVGDVWFSELIEEYWRFQNVSPLRSESAGDVWNQCFLRPSQGQTYPLYHDIWDDNLLALCAVFPLLSGFPELSWFRTCCSSFDSGLPGLSERTEFFLWLTNNLLSYGSHRAIFDWFGKLGWLGRTRLKCFSKWLLNAFLDWSMFNCRAQFIIPFGPIEIAPQRDLRWWTRR